MDLARLRAIALLIVACPVLAQARPREVADDWPRYRVEADARPADAGDRRGFVLGGIGFWSDDASLFASSWSVGGGVTLPVNAWFLVPRVDVDGGGERSSSGWMVRSTLGGRIPTGLTDRHTYLEGGLGVLYFETTLRGDPGHGIPSQVHSGTQPCFALASGITSAPDARPGFVLEAQTVIANGARTPSVIVARVGILF